jgi:hypothetical protein
LAGVEFIDENGGGLGVRLRQSKWPKPWQRRLAAPKGLGQCREVA